jgi:anaerobic ribonucleoside-triphosphate reductase activating protein
VRAVHYGFGEPGYLRVARVIDQTRVLGPDTRAGVSVQGCLRRCRGCHSPAGKALDGGERLAVPELAERLLALPIDGITFSGGGEPMLQAAALVALCDRLRARRPELSLMSYSGYRFEVLRDQGSPAQRALLDRLDLLVDGPYVAQRHAQLRWRGSSNQRLIALTPRHAGELLPDEHAGMEFEIDEQLRLSWVGVPPRPGFLEALGRIANGQPVEQGDVQ